jgi:hypothetical protein
MQNVAMKKKLKAIWLRLQGKHICQHGDCLKVGMQCHLNDYRSDYDWRGDLFYWYCPEHCQIEGFCGCCGEFWGGCEAFDFNRGGLCPNCQSELDAEFQDDYEHEMAELYHTSCFESDIPERINGE